MALFKDKRNGSVTETNPSYAYKVDREMPMKIGGGSGGRDHKWFSDKKAATRHAKSVSKMGYNTYTTKHDTEKGDYATGKPAKSINAKAAITKFLSGHH